MSCVLLLLLSTTSGLCLGRLCLGGEWERAPASLRVGLGIALGFLTSGLITFWALVAVPRHLRPAIGVAALVSPFLFIGLDRVLRRGSGLPRETSGVPRGRSLRSLPGTLAFFAAVALLLVMKLDFAVQEPQGGWDAWAVWNLRARFFAECPQEWTRGFDPELCWSAPEYPVLLPCLLTYGWTFSGRSVVLMPVAVALLAHVGLLLLIVGLCRRAFPESLWPWWLGTFYVLLPVEWEFTRAWQYADRPLALFLTGGVGCLGLSFREGGRRWLLPAGLLIGAAAFCKNEGKPPAALLGLAAVVRLVGCGWRGRGGPSWGALAFLAGMAPGLASILAQRWNDPAPTGLVQHMKAGSMLESERTREILEHLLSRMSDECWGWAWWAFPLVFLVLLPLSWRRGVWVVWSVGTYQLVVYMVVFQLTPFGLTWHLERALPRLLLHVFPLYFLAASWSVLGVLGTSWAASGRSGGRSGEAPGPAACLRPYPEASRIEQRSG